MPRLAFKKQFVGPIIEQAKTQTIRRKASCQVGDLVPAYCEWGKPPFAVLRVKEVFPIQRSEITEGLARSDGFGSLDDLLDFLAKHYPRKRKFYVIRFEVIPK